jgi:hypothetical protein
MQSVLNSHFAATSTISSGTGFDLGGANGTARGQVTDAICAKFSLCTNVNDQFRYRVRFGRNKWFGAGSGDGCNLC